MEEIRPCFFMKPDGTTEKRMIKFIDGIPEGGKLIQIGSLEYIFRPRGTLQKNSLSLYIYERLESEFRYWTDKKYEDRPDPKTVIEQLKKNLNEEVNAAFDKFLNKFCKGESK